MDLTLIALMSLVVFEDPRSRDAGTPAVPGRTTMTGIVKDKDTHQPIAGVTVVAQCPQGELAEVTDDSGNYVMADVPAGKCLVLFFASGGGAPRSTKEVHVAAGVTIRVNARISQREEAASKAPPASAAGVSTSGCGRRSWSGPIDAWQSEPDYFTAQHVIYRRAYTQRLPLR